MDSPEVPTGKSDIKDRIVSQFKLFRDFLGRMMGLNSREQREIAVLAESKNSPDSKSRQQKILKAVLGNLIRKKILATPTENYQFYEQQFGLTGYSSPEMFLGLPGGATAVDEKTGRMKIYLNPHLDMFDPGYQILSILEEAIHYFQAKHQGTNQILPENELDSKERLLRMADFLGLSTERRAYLDQKRDSWAQKVSELKKRI